MGRGASPLVAKEATHLGLVVLDPERTHLLLGAGSDSALSGSVSVHGRVFLVPEAVVTQHARPIWSKRNEQPSKGRFRYLRLDTVETYEVAFPKRVGARTGNAAEETAVSPSTSVAADGDVVEFRFNVRTGVGAHADAGEAPAGPGRTPCLPVPTGPCPVGTTSLWLTDTSRPDPWAAGVTARELMVSLWYPATSPDGRRAPYMTRAESELQLTSRGITGSRRTR